MTAPTHRDYHTPAMRRELQRLRGEMERAKRRGGRALDEATKQYMQLRDYMEKIGPEEWAAECRLTNGKRGRR